MLYHDLVTLRALMIVLAVCAFLLVVGLDKLLERCARKLASLREARSEGLKDHPGPELVPQE
jgi:hypothetical protein